MAYKKTSRGEVVKTFPSIRQAGLSTGASWYHIVRSIIYDKPYNDIYEFDLSARMPDYVLMDLKQQYDYLSISEKKRSKMNYHKKAHRGKCDGNQV